MLYTIFGICLKQLYSHSVDIFKFQIGGQNTIRSHLVNNTCMLKPRFTKRLITVTVIDDYNVHGDDNDYDDSDVLLDGPD